MEYPVILRDVVDPSAAAAARELIESEVRALWRDYGEGLSLDDYKRHAIYPDSRHLLFLQERCLYRGIVGMLISRRLVEAVGEHIPRPMFFGIAFVRYAFPGMTSNGEAFVDDVLNSPFHYDDYHGAETRTTWIPLQDTSPDTGSFAFTRDPETVEMTGGGFSPTTLHNAADMGAYIEKLRETTQESFCRAGNALLFDRHLLHGATYPCAMPRISVDLRWADPAEAGRLAKARSKYRRRLCPAAQADRFMRTQALRRLHDLGDTAFLARVGAVRRLLAPLRWKMQDARDAARLKLA